MTKKYERQTKMLGVQVTPAFKERVINAAEKKYLNASDIVRIAVIEGLERNGL